ncbi:MAG: universal stress protein, partial [Bacteroidota bacterium]
MEKLQKILVPTDFSDFSKRATRFAILLANHFECEVTLYHLFQTPSSTGSFRSARDVIRKDALVDMQKLEKEMQKLLEGKTSIQTIVAESNAVDAIVARAKRDAYDLIVMGTKGATGLKEVFIGSIAGSVLKKAEVPMLVIPEEATFESLESLVLAIDERGIEKGQNFELLKLLTKSFNASLNIIHVETGTGDLEVRSQVEFFFEEMNYQYFNLESSGDVNTTINQFATDQKADLICMIRRKRS